MPIHEIRSARTISHHRRITQGQTARDKAIARWGGRVVECTGFEIRRGAQRHRGFESHPHRLHFGESPVTRTSAKPCTPRGFLHTCPFPLLKPTNRASVAPEVLRDAFACSFALNSAGFSAFSRFFPLFFSRAPGVLIATRHMANPVGHEHAKARRSRPLAAPICSLGFHIITARIPSLASASSLAVR